MKAIFKRFRKNEDGATAIEYGLIAALIAVFIMGAVGLVGGGIKQTFTDIATKLGATETTTPPTGGGTPPAGGGN